MDESKPYIVEIARVIGESSVIYLESDGKQVHSLFAIMVISDGGASIVDNCYGSIGEAKEAWPEAIPPKPFHLTSEAIRENCTVRGITPHKKLT